MNLLKFVKRSQIAPDSGLKSESYESAFLKEKSDLSSDTVENVSSQSVQFKDKGSSGAVGDGDFVSRISDFSTFNRSSTRGKSSI